MFDNQVVWRPPAAGSRRNVCHGLQPAGLLTAVEWSDSSCSLLTNSPAILVFPDTQRETLAQTLRVAVVHTLLQPAAPYSTSLKQEALFPSCSTAPLLLSCPFLAGSQSDRNDICSSACDSLSAAAYSTKSSSCIISSSAAQTALQQEDMYSSAGKPACRSIYPGG